MLLLLVLAVVAVELAIGLGTSDTGPVEKVVLLLLLGGCVYAAAKVSTVTDWVVHRLVGKARP